MVEQLSEHELICGSEAAWEHGEGEVVDERQPSRASGCETTMSSRGRQHGVVEAPLSEKHQPPLPDVSNVEVVLEHLHRCCYRRSLMWSFYWEGL
jgi:hypothetical protein